MCTIAVPTRTQDVVTKLPGTFERCILPRLDFVVYKHVCEQNHCVA